MSALYNISINKFGINANARYKINTANNDQYYFGNKFSAGSLAYYTFGKSNLKITPNAGFEYEFNEMSKLQNQKIDQTGGYLLSSVMGLEMSFKKITFGLNAHLPLGQNFASGQTETKLKGMAHLTFSL